MKKSIHLISFIVLLFGSIPNFLFAQSSIKLKKQQTDFFYVQLNGHFGQYGIDNQTDDKVMGFANYGSSNQIAFQWLSKNKKRLQRGFTDKWEKGNFFIRMNIESRPTYLNDKELVHLQFKLNSWLSIFTKWDRTSLHIGSRNLPYGHNPRIDADFSFISPQVKKDIGFSKDFGLFFKTPINKYLDIESALTLGGYLSRPILSSRVINQPSNNEALLQFNNFAYKGTWLLTNRIGVPTYKSWEYGIFTSIGHIYSPNVQGECEQIYRVGADWIIKYKDMLKFASQVSYGSTNPDSELYNTSKSFSIQNTLDCTLFGILNMSFSHSWQYFTFHENPTQQKRTLAASTMLVLTPDIKVKCNMFKEFNLLDNGNKVGIFGQLIFGFGKRP